MYILEKIMNFPLKKIPKMTAKMTIDFQSDELIGYQN